MAKITVLEAYANVLHITESMAFDLEKRASVTKEIDRFSAGDPTAPACAPFREKLRQATKRRSMPKKHEES